MPIHYLKKASKTAHDRDTEVRQTVSDMLTAIRAGGDDSVRDYTRRLDNYTGDIIVSPEVIRAAVAATPEQTQADLKQIIDRVGAFARAQKDSIREFETELAPGLFAGQRLVAMQSAGCYIPGGRYAHIASAVMSVTTAKIAGVEQVTACTPPREGGAPHPAILCALHFAGADRILASGGVQGIAALAFGLFGGKPADIIAGPGNRFVAEAKRMLFGEIGIDMFAGPTEIAIIADAGADAHIVATDLVGQAEHGLDSPAWLISTDKALAEEVAARMPALIADLPPTARAAAETSWRDYGEIVVCSTREEAVTVSDAYAAEHLEVQAEDLNWWQAQLKNYGSLFLGEETTVAYGDKCSGTNHILPTKKAARYTGGLSVHKFMKILTTQRMNRDATRDTAALCARISRMEGMEAHARTADARLQKYFPDESFVTDASS